MRWVTASSRSKNILSFCLVNVDAIAESIGTVLMDITIIFISAKNVERKHRVVQKEKQS